MPLSKLIFTVAHHTEDHRRQQMAGQFHLTDHFDLRVERRFPGMLLSGESDIVLWHVQCASEHAKQIDSIFSDDVPNMSHLGNKEPAENG